MADVTTSTTGAIRFTGLGSGTDFDSLITQLVEVEKTRTKQLTSWRSEWESKNTEFDKLTSALLSLKTTLTGMNTPDKFLTKTVTSSNAAVLTATATSSAEQGSHSVDVATLATTNVLMGAVSFAAADTHVAPTGGKFAFTYAGQSLSVDLTTETTLTDLANLINSDADNKNYVRASAISDGAGYRLQIRGLLTGAGNDIIVDDGQTTLTDFKANQFIQTQKASNAKFRVDGWPVATADSFTHDTTYAGDTKLSPTGYTAFAFTYAGKTHSVSISDTATIWDLEWGINSAVGFKMASVKAEGANWRLQLTGETGWGNKIKILGSPDTTLPGFSPTDFNQTSNVEDGYMDKATNSVSDILAGMTLNLTSTGTTAITTVVDSTTILKNAQAFVDSVNTALSLIQEQTKVTTTGSQSSKSILTGNYGVQMIQQKLKTILAQKGVGFDYDLDAITSLYGVGISTDATQGSPTFGLLALDTDKFSKALSANPNAVARIFSADLEAATEETTGGTSTKPATNFKYYSATPSTQGGEYAVEYTITGGVVSGTINGFPATYDTSTHQLTAQYITDADGNSLNPAQGLAIQILNITDGTYSGATKLKVGKTTELAQEISNLTNVGTGTLPILKENYQDIMDSIDDKIAYESRRLTLMEKNLRLRFANLEAVLGTYNNISTQLTSQISGLNSKKS